MFTNNSQLTVEATYGLAFIYCSMLGRDLLHGFCRFAENELAAFAYPWVPLHLVPSAALATYLHTLTAAELNFVRLLLTEQSKKPFLLPEGEEPAQTVLIPPPGPGTASPRDPRTRELCSTAQDIITLVYSPYNEFNQAAHSENVSETLGSRDTDETVMSDSSSLNKRRRQELDEVDSYLVKNEPFAFESVVTDPTLNPALLEFSKQLLAPLGV